MLIFHYVSAGVLALGAFMTAVGIAFAVSYNAATSEPPDSLEEEQSRNRMGNAALALVIIGLVMCGVGVLFM